MKPKKNTVILDAIRGLNKDANKDIRIILAYGINNILVLTAIDKFKETDHE